MTRAGRTGLALGVVAALVAIALFILLSKGATTPGISPADEAAGKATTRAVTTASSRPEKAIASERFVEALSVAKMAPESQGRLEIEVVTAAEAPAAGAKVFLHREQILISIETTDVQGVAGFKPRDGEAQIIVIAANAAAYRGTVSLQPGRRRIELLRGATLAGRVEVNGQAPQAPVTFGVDDYDSNLPQFVYDTLGYGKVSSRFTTDAQGSFEATGFREGARCGIGFSFEYRLEGIVQDGKPLLTIVAPAAGLLLKLARVPMIRGRVVSKVGGGLPVPNAFCSGSYKGPFDSMTIGVRSDDAGRFALPAASPFKHVGELSRAELSFANPDRTGARELVLEPLPTEDRDLGDIEIAGGRKIVFVARDPGGAAIEGAYARVGAEVDRSSRTDSEGRGSIAVSEKTREFFVGALRYAITKVEIPDVPPEVLPLTLLPCAGLDLRVIRNTGASWGTQVTLSSERASADASLFRNDPIHVACGANHASDDPDHQKGNESLYGPSEHGRIVVAGLPADIPINLVARNTFGEVHDIGVVTLARGEWKTLDLDITKSGNRLRGRVRDAAGDGIEDARVVLDRERDHAGARSWATLGGDVQMGTTTDASGRFELGGFNAEVVHFSIYKPGYVTLIRKDFAVPHGEADLEFVLTKSCKLTVRANDADGSPIRQLEIWGEVEGLPKEVANEIEPGVYVLVDLPPDAPASITTDWAGGRFTRTVMLKGDQTEQIVMPATGSVVVDISALEGLPFEVKLLARAHPGVELSHWVSEPRLPNAPPVREVTIAPVVPGTYALKVECTVDGEMADGAAPDVVTVQAGQTARLVARKP